MKKKKQINEWKISSFGIVQSVLVVRRRERAKFIQKFFFHSVTHDQF